MGSFMDGVVASLGRIAKSGWQAAQKQRKSRSRSTAARERNAPPLQSHRYPGDYRGNVSVTYAPHKGKLADPGEVVWTWVPFKEDHSQGKDRPVLIIGRDGDWLLGLPLTSKDHDRDAAQEASEDRFWVDIGSGPWDTRGKPSEARVNRIIRVHPDEVRRIGGQLPKARFDKVAAALRRHWNG